MYKLYVVIFSSLFSISALAQTPPLADEENSFNLSNKGLSYEHDPTHFKLNFRFRVQGRATYEDYDSEDPKNVDTVDFAIRRLRMRFEGTAMDPRLLYRVQLAFTRFDMDWDTTNYPNILRDAVVGWRFHPRTVVWFGQTKLPGNRQRFVSSGNQEFVDRSLLNATFTLDRDLGVQLWQEIGVHRPIWIKLALSNGEGRAVPNQGMSLAYTGRVEWLPLGSFKENGDYSEADLAYEERLKISLAGGYNYNKNTSRLGGQIGKLLKDNQVRTMRTTLADMLFKYRGWAWSTEFADRRTDNPVIAADQAVYEGRGFNTQLSYVFPSHLSPAVRWTRLWADNEILSVENDRTQYAIGLSKYFKQHLMKIQSDITYEQVTNPMTFADRDNFIFRIQFEVGI